MGKWRGRSSVPKGGDWSHSGELNLKFNQHASTKSVSGADTKKIGRAYIKAAELVSFTLDKLHKMEDATKNQLEQTFTADYDLGVIVGVLDATLKGLRVPENNAIYLYTKTSKPEQAGYTGYVASYSGNVSAKRQRQPLGHNATHNTPEYKGHIHLNLTEVVWKDGDAALINAIIHEATHRFASTGDFAYANSLQFMVLSAGQRMNNADSYSHFCQDLERRFL